MLLSRTTPTEVALPSATTHDLEKVAADMGLAAPPRRIAAQLAPFLAADVHDALLDFRQAKDCGALLIRGVGPGSIPEQAATYSDLPTAGPLLLGMVSLVATPAFAAEEWDGSAITDVKITAGLETTVSSKGCMELPVHQETQHLAHPPDGLALLMVQGGSPTRIAFTMDILHHMDTEYGSATVERLREPAFAHRTPDSFGSGGLTKPGPILFGPDDMPELRVDLATTVAVDDSAAGALTALAASAAEIAYDVQLTPGSLILLDNRRWLHGRGELAATATSRWLLRSLFVCDSWSTQRERDHVEAHGIVVCL
jgi:Taurine catabolism dioxygenase TauD, TfdA family